MTGTPDGPGVLVLDGDSQCSLAIIRSLGRKGVDVTVGDHSARALGMRSRYSAGRYVHPDPQEDAATFLEDLTDHLQGADYLAVIPVEDHTSALLAREKPTLEATGVAVATEDPGPFETAFDKGALFEALATCDVPVPRTFIPASVADVEELAPSVPYPAVVKPRSKSQVTEDGYSIARITERNYVESPEDLVETYRSLYRAHQDAALGAPIIQAYVPGRTTTVVGLAEDGELVAYFQEERLRTYPASGGNSALLGALDDDTMLAYAERVLDRLEWTGPVMVEFMRTPSGEYALIEVNGRYWGSLPFAVAAGVDVPWLHYLQLAGVDPSPFVEFGEYRTDIVQRRLLYEDLLWFGERLDRREFGAIGPFLWAFLATRHTFVDFEDPVPTVAALAQAARLGASALTDRLSWPVTKGPPRPRTLLPR